MATWYSSDLHFGHVRIIELCGRPFKDVNHMNNALIENFNELVRPDDKLILTGDIALGTIAESLPLVGRLNGYKILVPGNHDRIFGAEPEAKRARFLPEYQKVFQEIWPDISHSAVGHYTDRHDVLISHLPYTGDSHAPEDRYKDRRPADDGLPLICGHVHEKWKFKDRQFNCGVDVNDFKPVHESEIVAWIKSL